MSKILAVMSYNEFGLRKHLNSLLDVCLEHMQCPDCLQDKGKCKRKCRVTKAILYLAELANQSDPKNIKRK